MVVRFLAEQGKIFYPGGPCRHSGRDEAEGNSRGQYSPGLAVLGRRPVGQPRVRGIPLPRSRENAGRRARDARPFYDKRVAQVLHQHRALQGAQGGRLCLYPRRRYRPRGLAGTRAVVLRRLCRGRTQDVLAPDGRDPLQPLRPEDRRLVDGRFRAEPPRLPADGLPQVAAHAHGPRTVY